MVSFLATFIISLNPVNYRGKIWWVKPDFEVKVVNGDGFMEFRTPISADEVFLLSGGRVFVHRGNHVRVYDPSFSVVYSFDNLKGLKNAVCGECDLDILNPFMDGENMLAGFADRKGRRYYLVKVNLSSGDWKVVRVLDAFHFPEIAPIMKVRKLMEEEPEFARDYLSHFYDYGHFQTYPVIDGRAYLWFYPDYGLHFGGLYIYDVEKDSLISISDRFGLFIGTGNGYFTYTLFEDDDASTLEKAIHIRRKGREFRIGNADGSMALVGGDFLFYRIYDTDTFALYDVSRSREISRIRLDGENLKLLSLSPSGRLLFFTGAVDGKESLYAYDFASGRIVDMFPQSEDMLFSHVNVCFDGEFFLFIHRDDVWAGYGADNTAPIVRVKVKPSYKGIAFQKRVRLVPEIEDRCFVSSAEENISINGRHVRDGREISVNLEEGNNPFKIRVSDMAGNILDTTVEVVYMEPIKVKIARIGESPEEFSGKVVVLEGYGKGWMAEGSECSGLPMARNNTARSGSDGTFCDETASVFFPIAPREKGRFRVYAVVRMVEGGWILEPIKLERLE